MKRLASIFCLIFAFSYSFGIVLNKIKITGNTHTDAKTILEIAQELKDGEEYSEEKLKNLALRIEERLKNTGWFYNASVYIVESGQNENYRNVIIEVEEGFLYRFYGGNAYGGFGMDNVYGQGGGYRIELGYNRQALRYEKLFPSYHLKFTTDIGNINRQIYSSENREIKLQSVLINSGIFYLMNWDLLFYLDGEYSKNFDTSYNWLFDSYFAGCGLILDKRNKRFSPSKGYYLKLSLNYLDFNYLRFSSEGRIFFELMNGLTFGTKVLFATEDENVPYYHKLSINGIDGVRNLFSYSIGNSIVQANLELRWKVFNYKLFSMIDTFIETLVFVDFGKATESLNEITTFDNYGVAFGTGVRIFFDNPVFLPLRFEVGFDKDFKTVFYFDASYPF